jgi:DNA-binding response OmpR family regulator
VLQQTVAHWNNVQRFADLFDVVVASHEELGHDPLVTIAALTTPGLPPLIVLGKSMEEEQRVQALVAGAAYCLADLAGPRELAARISALTRRRTGISGNERCLLIVGDWVIDVEGHRAVRPGRNFVDLTPTEFMVFSLLVSSQPRVLTRAQIISRTSTRDRDLDPRTIDTIVSRIRRKLRQAGALPTFNLHSVRSEGYVCKMPHRPRMIMQGRSKWSGSRKP